MALVYDAFPDRNASSRPSYDAATFLDEGDTPALLSFASRFLLLARCQRASSAIT